MTLMENDRQNFNEQLYNLLNELQGATVSNIDNSNTNNMITALCDLLEQIPINLLPYSAVSRFVYNDNTEDILYFIEFLEEKIEKEFEENKNQELFEKGLKLIEHLELAKHQKDFLFEEHDSKINQLESISNHNLRSFNRLKKLYKITNDLQEQNQKMTNHFISILGIFAAILMGAFGAIQGFTSLFSNAHKLSLGKILIISSIGASAVILILFLLLNSIAKLIEKPLSHSCQDNDNTLFKYPTLVISYGILVLVSLIGAALELSNTKLVLSWYGLWWALPGVWLVYFTISIKKENFLWPLSFINRNKTK